MPEAEARVEGLISKLRERGYRVTPQRAAVLRVLASSDEHPSVEQIYEVVRSDFPMTSLATVYKTLALLKDLGEVFELSIVGGSTRYDGCKPDFHPHLICVQCKRIVDLEAAPGGQACEDVEERTGYLVLSHRHDFYGVCPACRGNQGHLGGAAEDRTMSEAVKDV